MAKIGKLDVLIVLSELNNELGEGDKRPSREEITQYLRESEELSYEEFRKACEKPLGDFLLELMEQDYIKQEWSKAAFRFQLTSKGSAYLKRQTG